MLEDFKVEIWVNFLLQYLLFLHLFFTQYR